MNVEKLFVKTTVNFTFCLIIKAKKRKKRIIQVLGNEWQWFKLMAQLF